MVKQTEAVIFLNERRECLQADWYRSYQTRGDQAHLCHPRENSENLEAINDNTLKGGSTLRRRMIKDQLVLIIPVVGELYYKTNAADGTLDVGQSLLLSVDAGEGYEISNVYENELINFLEVRIRAVSPLGNHVKACSFDLNVHKDRLVPLITTGDSQTHTPGWIGKFGGRQEGVYQMIRAGNEVFVFVIDGVFEVQNRLLHARDGLALFHAEDIEFEALSEGAVIIFLEFGF